MTAPDANDLLRSRGADALRRALDSGQPYKGNGPEPGPGNGPASGSARGSTPPGVTLESAAASTFQMRGIQWFWPNRFALGKLGLIGGLPDRGKGLIISYMIAAATKGSAWPCSEGQASPGNVLLLTAEDDVEDTIVPRLVAADADTKRVHIIKMIRDAKGKRMFNLITDLPALVQKIDEIGNVVMIVIDPMSSYLGVGKIDSYRATDVRGVLSPLTELAAEKRLAIIAVMHFNKKADIHNAMLRIADSLAYVAAARHCYVVVDDPDNKRRLFVKAKNNLAPDTKALSYTIDTVAVGIDEATGETITAPRIVWGSAYVDVTASEAMQAEEGAGSSPVGALGAAKKFLADILATGPVAKQEIEEAAEANSISVRTLARAKAELGVAAEKDGFRGRWEWRLPEMPEMPF